MRVLVFGGSGMVGQGVLKECERDGEITDVLAVGRSASGVARGKVRELVCPDLYDLSGVEVELTGFDACFFCLGTSSAGMSEADYRRVTYELTMRVARTLLRLNPGMVFEYVSGAGTDSTARGKTMWARVKGQTENELLGLGFKGAYMFRPGGIVPLDGIRSKTAAYRFLYAVLGPVLPLLKRMFPKYVTTTRELGRAMIRVAKNGFEKRVVEAGDIGRIAQERQAIIAKGAADRKTISTEAALKDLLELKTKYDGPNREEYVSDIDHFANAFRAKYGPQIPVDQAYAILKELEARFGRVK